MKRVLFEIAKVLKEAGYPQPQKDIIGYYNIPSNFYFTGSHSYYNDYRELRLDWDETNELHTIEDWAIEVEPHFYGDAIAAPTYLEVWLWLWQEKNIHIEIIDSKVTTQCYATINGEKDTVLFNSPEEAIEKAIEYLVENNLVK